MATFDSYATISLSANQTARISVGNHIEFDTADYVGTVATASTVALSTGSGQSNGQITLSGYRFVVIAGLRGETNEGRIICRITDGSGTEIAEEVDTGIPGHFAARDSNMHDTTTAVMTTWMMIDASASDVTFEMRFTELNNPVAIYLATRLIVAPIL